MDVRLGWSGEIHGVWTKMDVEVNDADFDSLLVEHSVHPSSDKITPLVKFKVMYAMAETFVQLHKMTRYPEIFASEDDKLELQNLVGVQNKLIASLK